MEDKIMCMDFYFIIILVRVGKENNDLYLFDSLCDIVERFLMFEWTFDLYYAWASFNKTFTNFSLVILYFVFITSICFRYLLQHHSKKKNSVLHGKSDRPLRWHLIPLSLSILLTSWFRRENCVEHLHITIPNYVLPSDLRNHSFYVTCIAIAGKISSIYYVAGRPFSSHHHYNTERSLPEA